MKKIYLVRHAKAVKRGSEPIDDFERFLIDSGRNDAEMVSLWLAEKGVGENLLLISSPAERAYDTARIFAKAIGYRVKSIRTRKSLYDQGEGSVLEVVRELDDKFDEVMIVGHDPALSEFAVDLAPDFNTSMSTSSLVGIEVEKAKWAEVEYGDGKLLFHEKPLKKNRELVSVGRKLDMVSLDRKLSWKKLKKELETQIEGRLIDMLSEIDTRATQNAEKNIKKAATSIAEAFFSGLKKDS